MKIKELEDDGYTLLGYSVREDIKGSKEEIKESIINAYTAYKNGLTEKYIDVMETTFVEPERIF